MPKGVDIRLVQLHFQVHNSISSVSLISLEDEPA